MPGRVGRGGRKHKPGGLTPAMSFQSTAFLLLFLPAVLAGTALARRYAPDAVVWWLIGASLLFHGAWHPDGVPVLLGSVAANRLAVEALHRAQAPRLRQAILVVAVLGNLALLAWFRYLTAWMAALDPWLATGPILAEPIAPLGISFFTFTQIGYLLDCHAGLETRRTLGQHILFSTFFPSLTAGPILTAREVMPQLDDFGHRPWHAEDLACGLGIFIIGLLKKLLLADPLAPIVAAGHADPTALGLFGAWRVALAYWFQLYFDFSGYSDMAVGLARMFGVRYPWNFASPYQARSVIEYWQRWHVSLTRFFMASLHAPLAMAVLRWRRARGLGVDRAAQSRPVGFLTMHAAPLVVTMTLAGLWHGASVTFLAFGLLHGVFLAVNHAWRLWRSRPGAPRPCSARWAERMGAAGGIGATCVCVLIGSVVFRAASLGDAVDLLAGMAGWRGLEPLAPTARDLADGACLALLLVLVWCAPNTRRIMDHPIGAGWAWRASAPWAVACGVGLTIGLLSAGGSAEFLYARF
jgi:D-alanyl-lipoteichoic acid acyltransferase DltB (MBOAT superfamily)